MKIDKIRKQDQFTKKVMERLMEKAPELIEEILGEEEISRELQRIGRSRGKA